jgi:hypothetical protein
MKTLAFVFAEHQMLNVLKKILLCKLSEVTFGEGHRWPIRVFRLGECVNYVIFLNSCVIIFSIEMPIFIHF